MRYGLFSVTALFTMFAGAQTVHFFYRPLDDLPQLVQQFYNEHPEVSQTKKDPYQETLELNIKKKVEAKKIES